MKNTMKKLLCMALVIMLLVSAVPAFAMADDGFGDDLTPMVEDFNETPDAASVNEPVVVSNDPVVSEGEGEGEVAEGGASLKIYAYLYTGNQDLTQFKSVKSYSGKNVNGSLTVADLLKKTEFLGQGVYDSNGISEFQKYTYYVSFNDKKVSAEDTAADANTDLTGSLEAGCYTFVRVRKQIDVTLMVDGDTVYGEKTIKANTYDVLNLPTVFKNNGLKANSGNYIYMYTRDEDDTPLGNNFRVPGNVESVTIIGHQDLLGNKAENDANGVGTPGTSGGTTGGTTSGSSGNSSANGSTGSNKFPYPVYLNIYKDTLVGSPDKRVEITKGAALDGTVTLSEVKNVVKNYYTAKDSDGISYDGLYIAEGNWVADYVADTAKYDSIDAGTMRQTGTVYINVMIGNAKAKSSSTADASNPKTGDAIFVPMMVMGLTGTALAAAYVFGKKRIAR